MPRCTLCQWHEFAVNNLTILFEHEIGFGYECTEVLTASWNSNLQCQCWLCWDSSMALRKIGLAKIFWSCCWYNCASRLAISNFTSSKAFLFSESFHCALIRKSLDVKSTSYSTKIVNLPLVLSGFWPSQYFLCNPSALVQFEDGYGLPSLGALAWTRIKLVDLKRKHQLDCNKVTSFPCRPLTLQTLFDIGWTRRSEIFRKTEQWYVAGILSFSHFFSIKMLPM